MSLTDADIDRIARRTAEILAVRAPQTTLDADGLMLKLGCSSLSATYRLASSLKIRPYARGKYRTADVEAAIARASQNAIRRAA